MYFGIVIKQQKTNRFLCFGILKNASWFNEIDKFGMNTQIFNDIHVTKSVLEKNHYLNFDSKKGKEIQ